MASSNPGIDVKAMEDQAGRAAALLGAMCNEKRLLILCQLLRGECPVNELAELLSVAQPTVSQHLAVLRREGLVVARQEGQAHFYSLAGAEAREILGALHSLFCAPEARTDDR